MDLRRLLGLHFGLHQAASQRSRSVRAIAALGGGRKDASRSPASAPAISSRVNQRASSSSVGVDGQRVAVGLGVAADHQRRREGPRLAGDIADVADPDAGFLVELARDGRLERFADLDEAGERRIAARRIVRLAAEEQAAVDARPA